MIVYPNAKINIGLRIVSKRPDSFHNIETCFYPVNLVDILEFVESSTLSFTTSGVPIPGDNKDNICLKAWELLNQKFKIPKVSIHLHKIIPIGAGLGGGSADGAFMLKELVKFFGIDVSDLELASLAGHLGSDCPFFLLNSPAIGTGRGDILKPVQLLVEEFRIVLVNPGVHVSTADAYSSVNPSQPECDLENLLERPVSEWQGTITNDFEKGVFRKYPEIEQVKKQLLDIGAVYASMSGSGSTVFGLFKHIPENLQEIFKDFFVYYEK